MKVSRLEVDIPEKCPTYCPKKGGPYFQGDFCSRCPVFNCSDDDPLIRPDDYNAEWAIAFRDWFNRGCVGEIYLSFTIQHKGGEQ